MMILTHHLEEIYAHTFKAEDALVRPQIISYSCNYISIAKYTQIWR